MQGQHLALQPLGCRHGAVGRSVIAVLHINKPVSMVELYMHAVYSFALRTCGLEAGPPARRRRSGGRRIAHAAVGAVGGDSHGWRRR